MALGGTAGAAGVELITGADIQDRSITGADIKAGSLSGRELKRGSVASSDIRDGTLRGADFAPDTLAALLGGKGATGPTGATGAAGATGATGATGSQGPAGAPATLESVGATGPDVTNYQDGDPLVTTAARAAGYYLTIATGTATNTGASDATLTCGFDVAGTFVPATEIPTTAGNTTSGTALNVLPTTTANAAVKFECFGGGATTLDFTDLKIKLIKLADQ